MWNIYLAARYDRREEMQQVALKLEGWGHTVVSRWIDGHACADSECTPEELAAFATEDIADIQDADCLIAFTEDPATSGYQSGGRHVELGIALGAGEIYVDVIGPRENVFHRLPGIGRYDSIEEWQEAMRE